MAARGAILTARSYVEVFADLDKLRVGLKSGERMVANFATSIGNIGREMMKASAVLAAPQALAIKTFGSFEKSMSRVKALTRATDEQFQALSRRAQDLGRDTVFTAGDAADAMSVFALAGFKVEQILKAVGPALDLAAAGQIGIAEAGDISAKIMAGMGMTAEELAGAVDILAKAMSTANTDISQLGHAFKFVGPVAKSAGIRFSEITAAIQLLSNAGIQGEMAGTTLRGMIMTLGSPTDVAKKKLEELGVEILDSEGRVRSLADIIGQFEAAMSGMANGQRLEILGQIFPDRQAAGGIELIAQGSARLREYTAALEDAGGVAEYIAKTQLDNLWGRLQLIISATEAVSITFGSHLRPAIAAAQDQLIAFINGFDTWLQKHPEIAKGLVAVTLGLFGVGAALVAAKVALWALSKGLGILALFSNKWVALGAMALVASGKLHVAFDAVSRAVDGLQGVWSAAWKEMSQAVEEGNLERAVKIAFLTMKVTVLSIMAELRKEFEIAFAILDKIIASIEVAMKSMYGLYLMGEKNAHGETIKQARFSKDPKTGKWTGLEWNENSLHGKSLRMKKDPQTGKFVTVSSRGNDAESSAVMLAKSELRQLLDEKTPKAGPRGPVARMMAAIDWANEVNPQAAEAAVYGPQAPQSHMPTIGPSPEMQLPQLIGEEMAAAMSRTMEASKNLSPLGQFEKGTDQGLQLVLDALGQGAGGTLENIYEEMKTVAANTETQVELTRKNQSTPKQVVQIAVAKKRA